MEMENIMIEENTEVMEPEFETVEFETEESGGGNTALGMLIGAGLALATTAIVKGAKKLWQKHKAKKDAEADDDEIETADPADEEIDEVADK